MKYKTLPGVATTVIIAIVAGVLVVGGGATYYVLNSSDDEPQTAEVNQTDQSATTDSTPTNNDARSLYEAAITGSSQVKCDFVAEDGSSGVAYVDSETSLRVDVQTTDSGSAHFVRDDDFAYTWTDDSNEGFKVNIAQLSELGSDYQSFGAENFEAEAEADTTTEVNCEQQSINEELLTPPTSIMFQDYTQLNIPQQP